MSGNQKITTLSNLDPEVVARIQKLLRQTESGGRVKAMQIYMHEVGVGLKDAKMALDKEMEFLGIPFPIRRRI